MIYTGYVEDGVIDIKKLPKRERERVKRGRERERESEMVTDFANSSTNKGKNVLEIVIQNIINVATQVFFALVLIAEKLGRERRMNE